MKTRTRKPGLGLLVMLPLLWNCAPVLLSTDDTSVKTYVLNASIEPAARIPPTDAVLLVSLPKAQPGYESNGIVYTLEPLTLDIYTKSEWADTPANMLAPLVVDALEKTGAFRAVVAAPTQAASDLRLDLDIVMLRQEFFVTPSQAHIVLRAKLFDSQSREVIATKLLETTEPALSEDAQGGVQALNTALRSLLAELALFVTEQAADWQRR